jgi:hypothetical protein
MRRTFKRKSKTVNGLTQNQRDWLLMGYAHFAIKVPFRNDEQRTVLWKRHRDELMKSMFVPRIPGDFHSPFGNDLRPAEWWRLEAPEPRGVLNDAVRVDAANPEVFDKEPMLETDFEYLQRLGLLNDQDKAYMETECFKSDEKQAVEYREYCAAHPEV